MKIFNADMTHKVSVMLFDINGALCKVLVEPIHEVDIDVGKASIHSIMVSVIDPPPVVADDDGDDQGEREYQE